MLQAGDANQALGTALHGLEVLLCCNPLDCAEPFWTGNVSDVGHLTPIREPEALANVIAIKLEISRERSTARAALQQPGWVLGGRGEGAIGREDPISALR